MGGSWGGGGRLEGVGGGGVGRRVWGAANTFNNKERVYSRAVPLESTLPNISAMYIGLIYMYIV